MTSPSPTLSIDATPASEQRVLLIDLALFFGGTERRVWHLATSLAERGAAVVVACLEDGMLYPRLRDAGVRCVPLRLRRWDPRLLPQLTRIVRRYRPTVVDTHGVQSQFWGLPAAVLGRVPSLLVTVHSEYGEEQAGLRRAWWYEQVLRAARPTGAIYLAVSEPVRAYLVRAGIPEDRIALVWNAVPAPSPERLGDRDITRRELGLPDGAFTIVTAARLHPSKGHRFLVDALASLPAELPPVHWLIVGGGRERDELERQVDRAGLANQVHFLGFRDDIPALLHASDVFVLPSLAEGLPLVVLEATLQGLPVLACAVGGLPDAYEQGEIRMVPPEDRQALAAELRRLVEDASFREELAHRGTVATRARLTTETMIDGTLKAYTAAERKRSPTRHAVTGAR